MPSPLPNISGTSQTKFAQSLWCSWCAKSLVWSCVILMGQEEEVPSWAPGLAHPFEHLDLLSDFDIMDCCCWLLQPCPCRTPCTSGLRWDEMGGGEEKSPRVTIPPASHLSLTQVYTSPTSSICLSTFWACGCPSLLLLKLGRVCHPLWWEQD